LLKHGATGQRAVELGVRKLCCEWMKLGQK
jgi:hypothetical protein